MGLDLVELVMAVEEEFGIDIPDHDAEKISTPRKLADYVEQKRVAENETYCNYLAAFNLLRQSLIELFAFPRNKIKLDTKLKDLMSPEKWSQNWHLIPQKIQVTPQIWPSLELPVWIENSIFLTSFFIPLALFIIFLGFSFWWFLTSLVPALFISSVLFKLTTPLKTLIPKRTSTIKDLVFLASASSKLQFDESVIQKRIKEIVFDQLGIGEEDFWWDARWYEDLGCG